MTDVKKKRVKAEKPQWVGYLTEKQKEKLHDSIDPDASLGQRIAIIQKIHRMVLRNHKNDPAYETLYGAVITATNLFLDSAFYTPTLQASSSRRVLERPHRPSISRFGGRLRRMSRRIKMPSITCGLRRMSTRTPLSV